MVDVDDPLNAVSCLGIEAAHFARQTARDGTDGVLLGGHQLAIAFVAVVQLVEGSAFVARVCPLLHRDGNLGAVGPDSCDG